MPERQVPPPRTTLRWVATLGLVLAIPGIAFGAQVKGKLIGLEKLMNPVWAEAKDVSARTDSLGASPRPPCVPSSETSLPTRRKRFAWPHWRSRPQQPPALPLLITVGGGRTTPVTVVVAPGTRLHFENRDPFPHRLYGVGQTTFPPGDMVGMAARDWTAPGPGKYEIKDELSPSIRTLGRRRIERGSHRLSDAANGCVRDPSASAG